MVTWPVLCLDWVKPWYLVYYHLYSFLGLYLLKTMSSLFLTCILLSMLSCLLGYKLEEICCFWENCLQPSLRLVIIFKLLPLLKINHSNIVSISPIIGFLTLLNKAVESKEIFPYMMLSLSMPIEIRPSSKIFPWKLKKDKK